MISRRHFLRVGGWLAGAAGAVAATPQRAHALGLEEPSEALAGLYHRSLEQCSSGAYHRQVLADLDAAFAGQSLPPEEKEKIRAQAVCPICGCPIETS